MENNKKKVWIQTISGVGTQPFLRFVGDIPINDLIEILIKSRDNAAQLGYDNLQIHIQEETGIVDIGLFGERPFNDKELKYIDEMSVINRTKEISDTGLTRDEILTRNSNIDLIGDAYKNYVNKEHLSMSFNFLTQEEFINKIKTDDEFSKKWGIAIETKELSDSERRLLYLEKWKQTWGNATVQFDKDCMDKMNIPTKLTIINYNGQIQESYE